MMVEMLGAASPRKQHHIKKVNGANQSEEKGGWRKHQVLEKLKKASFSTTQRRGKRLQPKFLDPNPNYFRIELNSVLELNSATHRSLHFPRQKLVMANQPLPSKRGYVCSPNGK